MAPTTFTDGPRKGSTVEAPDGYIYPMPGGVYRFENGKAIWYPTENIAAPIEPEAKAVEAAAPKPSRTRAKRQGETATAHVVVSKSTR